ncbi:MAG: SRPBCC family protein [Flavobacteriales bacterium]|nr:SRPBCC family protein [Flavobacteriales bacterium]
MKNVKKVGIFIVSFIALLFIVALFAKRDYSVEREITINKSNTEVFNYLKHLKNQENFSTWAKMDPNMKRTYSGTDGTVGFVATWDSEKENVGTGEQEIIKIVDDKRLETELRFIKPWESTSFAYFTTEKIDSATTKVKWGFNGEMDYPMNVILWFTDIGDEVGKDFEIGLNNLKNILEKK